MQQNVNVRMKMTKEFWKLLENLYNMFVAQQLYFLTDYENFINTMIKYYLATLKLRRWMIKYILS